MSALETFKNNQVVRAYRQGWLAWLGANKTAFDFAQDGVTKLMSGREQLLEDLIQKGETVEELAQDNVGKVREFVEPRVSKVTDRVSSVRTNFFTSTKSETADRVAVLSDEVTKLSKSVSALNRKLSAKAATAKKAVKKPVAKKAASKAAPKAVAKPAPKAEATAVETKTAA